MDTRFERSTGNDEWLTPPYIIDALGGSLSFNLDPCAPINRPWDTAKHHFTRQEDGLLQDWLGRVWLNPPYGNRTGLWLRKLQRHGDGIALTFARTETKMFFDYVWPHAAAVFFLKGRLRFYTVTGAEGGGSGLSQCFDSLWGE